MSTIEDGPQRAPWHIECHYEDETSPASDLLIAYPDYDPDDLSEDSFFVRVDSLQVDTDGEATSTSQLWEARALARWCRGVLGMLAADHALERQAQAELADADDDDDEVEDGLVIDLNEPEDDDDDDDLDDDDDDLDDDDEDDDDDDEDDDDEDDDDEDDDDEDDEEDEPHDEEEGE